MAATPNNTEKPRRGQRPGAPTPSGGPSIWIQLAAAWAVFLLNYEGYSAVREYIAQQNETVPLSQIAADIAAGKISSVVVQGDQVTATYTDKTTKTSQKETEDSLTQTLTYYGITPAQLSGVKVTIEDESSLRFWALTLLPVVVSGIFLFGVIWYLSRQLRQ